MSDGKERKVAEKRYRVRSVISLDSYTESLHNYENHYVILDGDKPTGISYVDEGALRLPQSAKRTVYFQNREYRNIREAIFAYEDAAPSSGTDNKEYVRWR